MKKLAVTITGIACLLMACKAVGPDYWKPDVSLSGSFASLEWGISTGDQVGEGLARSWWEIFRDPTLEHLMAQAIARNHDLRIAMARLQQDRAHAMASATLRFPVGGVQSAYQRYRTSEASRFSAPLSTDGEVLAHGMTGNRSGNLFLAGLDASWEIDVFGGVRREIEAAYATLGAYEENLHDALVTLRGTLFHDESNFWMIGPSIRWPILNFKRLLAQLEVSRGVREETVARYELTVLRSLEAV